MSAGGDKTIVTDEMLQTLNPELRKILLETNTNITDPKDIEALSKVSVRELARLFDEIARGVSKKVRDNNAY